MPLNYSEETLRADATHCGVPNHMHDGIVRYILNGIPSGSFLMAVVSGDFWEMCRRADTENFRAFEAYSRFFYNYAPGGCFGSSEKVTEWIEHHGMEFKRSVCCSHSTCTEYTTDPSGLCGGHRAATS